MNNNSIKDLSSRLQDLSLQQNYSEESLDNIPRESIELEYRLHVARSAVRCGTKNPDSNSNNFQVRGTVRITNKYCLEEQGTTRKIISISPCYVQLKNTNTVVMHRRHWCNLALVTSKSAQ